MTQRRQRLAQSEMRGLALPAPSVGLRNVARASSTLILEHRGAPRDEASLQLAMDWLGSRYPELMPTTSRRISVADGPLENDAGGFTAPSTGDITVRGGMTPEHTVEVLAHELLHSHPESIAGRAAQHVDEWGGHSEEHEFLDKFGSAVQRHYLLERTLGRAATRDEVFAASAAGQKVIFQNGAPTIHAKEARDGAAAEVVYRLPEWSSIRKSFEQ